MGFEKFPGSGSPHKKQEWRNCGKCQGTGKDFSNGGECKASNCQGGKVKR